MADIESALVVRMEASLAKFEKQMAKARQVAGDSSTGIEKRFDSMNTRIAASADRAAQGITRIGTSAGASRFVLQNTANQLGDVAVQISSGTSASRALSQQLPQLLGGFGALGGTLGLVGPLLGTVAAIGIPVAIALANMGDGAGDLSEQMKELAKATDAYNAAARRASTSAGDLVAQYGDRAAEAQQILEYQQQIAAVRAQRAFGDVASSLPGEFAGIGAGITRQEVELAGQILVLEEDLFQSREKEIQQLKELGRARTETQNARLQELRAAQGQSLSNVLNADNALIKAIQTIRKELKVTTFEAAEMAATLAEIQTAGTVETQSEAMSRFAQQIFDATGGLKNADDQTISLYQSLLNAVENGLQFAQINLAAGVGAAADEAGRLATNLLDALNRQNALAAGYEVGANDPSGKVYGGRGRGPTLPERFEMRNGFVPVPVPARSAGGGGSGAADGLKEAERLFADTRTAAEKYAEELERINELHRLFPEIVTNEVRDRAVAALDDAAGKLSDTAKTLESSLEDMFASVVTGSASAKDAVASLLNELSRLLINSAFKSLGIGKWFDGLFGGLKPRAGGGMVSAGSGYMVGEVGPEPFFPKVDGRILSVSQAQSALRGASASGGSAGPTFNYSTQIDATGADQAAVARLEASMMAMHRSFEARTLATVKAGGKRGGL